MIEPVRYRDYIIEIPEAEPGAQLELIIESEQEGDAERLRLRYGQHPDGSYFLHQYAYDPSADLIELAKRFIDSREARDEFRREQEEGSMRYHINVAGLGE